MAQNTRPLECDKLVNVCADLPRKDIRLLTICLIGREESEAALLSTVFRSRWKEGVMGATFAAVFLIIFKIFHHMNLSADIKQAALIVIFGITRDIVFIIVAAEVLVWYKNMISEIRKRRE